MATVIESLSTSWRLKQGKSLIPKLLELEQMDIFRSRDDFEGDALNSKYQSTASGTASAAAAISTGVANGAILLDAGTDNGGRSDLSLGLHFTGSRNAICWFRAQVNGISNEKFEFGFTDVISGTDAGAVNAKATPTFNATDCVVLCYDTTDDAKLTLIGAKGGTAATVYDFATTISAATDYYFGVELRDTNARGFLLDQHGHLIEASTWMTDAVTSTVLLTPWAFQQNRSTTNRTMLIDSYVAYQRRTTA